jgi:hypothetical protein
LSSFISILIDVRQTGDSSIKDHIQIISSVDPLDWFPEGDYLVGGRMKCRPARAKIIAVLIETLMAILHSFNHR